MRREEESWNGEEGRGKGREGKGRAVVVVVVWGGFMA